MRPPDFWYGREAGRLTPRDLLAGRLLQPLGALYGMIADLKERASTPAKLKVPILCVGNLTLGGTGKTPIARAIAQRLRAAGIEAHLLTRGYLGRLGGPLLVDALKHEARDVGDEALLLASAAQTWVAKRRAQGARAAEAAGAALIVMDDGLQNPSLAKTLCLVVVDGVAGLGNGRVFPAGPLREPFARGAARADAFILMGRADEALKDRLAATGRPVFEAFLEPLPPLPPRGVYVAFAGIGRPEKFFETAASIGLEIAARVPFPDHHPFSGEDLASLSALAGEHKARLLTTEKDFVRLPADARSGVQVLAVRAAFAEPRRLDAFLGERLAIQPGPSDKAHQNLR